jgi:beta-lactam-binding protein with PASTA domain
VTREPVSVPDVVGMPFHVARDLAADLGLVLADPDPDAPPISGRAWPGLFYVTTQWPKPGAEILRGDSVAIEVERFEPDADA